MQYIVLYISFFADVTIVTDLFSLQISIPLSTGPLLYPSHALVVGPEQRSLEVVGRILKFNIKGHSYYFTLKTSVFFFYISCHVNGELKL